MLDRLPGGLFFIAGPCVIESETCVFEIAAELASISSSTGVPFIFKASFDKANRSSLDGFRGPGLELGLKILSRVREKFGLPVLSDVHSPEMISTCSGVLDVVQIPAFLARQTDFYVFAGKSQTILNVKKGQFMAPREMINSIDKFKRSGGKEISITERGTFFGYGNLVVDFRSIQTIKEMGVKYIYDATHSLQLPAAQGTSSGGEIGFLEGLARAQIAGGADAVFIETHPNPRLAKSDSSTQYPLRKLKKLIIELKNLYDFIHSQNHEENHRSHQST